MDCSKMETASKKRGTLGSQMGRPKTGSLSSFDEQLRHQVKSIRRQEAGYGATTILVELESKYHYSKQDLPHRSTIAAYLKQEGLTQKYEPHSDLPVEDFYPVSQPHDLWQLDARGNEEVDGIGTIALIDIKDVYSNAYICCFPALMKSHRGHPNTSDYQTALRLAFLRFGLPKRIQVDHATVFCENTAKSPFPRSLHLWLISLGVQLCFSRVHRPTDQAKVERSHQILFNQIIKGHKEWLNWDQLFDKCRERSHYLNYKIPSRSCNDLPPLVAMPQAIHSKRDYHPFREEKLIDINRVYGFLSKGKWYRKVASNKTVSLAKKIYFLPQAKPGQQIEISFCASCAYLLFRDANEHLIQIKPIKGIDPKSLMKSWGDLLKLPSLQIPIPFDWENTKVSMTLSDSS